jgi:hypothetical protein
MTRLLTVREASRARGFPADLFAFAERAPEDRETGRANGR